MTTMTTTIQSPVDAGRIAMVGGGSKLAPINSPSHACAPLRIPYELFRPIISHVHDPRDLRNLAVASRVTQPDAERYLHSVVKARGVREVVARCRFLVQNPRLALLVREIVFRDNQEKSWATTEPLAGLYSLISAALRNVPRLIRLDASILPSNALPRNCPFRLESFTHNNLVIGLDAVQFFTQQSDIKDLTLNPFSYYEMHHDDEHYRRQLYTVLPNLTSLSCGLSVAIRLVKNRPITQLIIPARPDCLESDQLERVIAALQSAPYSPLRRLTIERRFAGRDGLMCITKGLRELRSLSLVISYTSEWLQDLHALPYLRVLSVLGETYFDAHDPTPVLDDLRATCSELGTVYIRRSELSYSADQWVYRHQGEGAGAAIGVTSGGGEWVCIGDVDVRYVEWDE